VARLRAENRALVNSILGVAGIPPMRMASRAKAIAGANHRQFAARDAVKTPADASAVHPKTGLQKLQGSARVRNEPRRCANVRGSRLSDCAKLKMGGRRGANGKRIRKRFQRHATLFRECSGEAARRIETRRNLTSVAATTAATGRELQQPDKECRGILRDLRTSVSCTLAHPTSSKQQISHPYKLYDTQTND